MSLATEIFFEQLVDFFQTYGFDYKKSKSGFVKKLNDKKYSIILKFDGRGGLTILHHVCCQVEQGGEIIKRKNFNNFYLLDEERKMFVPIMYSQEALDLANKMDLKGLSNLDFKQKYPIEKIKASAKNFELFSKNNLFPFFDIQNFQQKKYMTKKFSSQQNALIFNIIFGILIFIPGVYFYIDLFKNGAKHFIDPKGFIAPFILILVYFSYKNSLIFVSQQEIKIGKNIYSRKNYFFSFAQKPILPKDTPLFSPTKNYQDFLVVKNKKGDIVEEVDLDMSKKVLEEFKLSVQGWH